MNIKRFVAKSPQEALQMVKREMGPEAVILKTRTLPGCGKGPAESASRVEVTAAVDYDLPQSSSAPPKERPAFDLSLRRWEILQAEIAEIKEALFSAEAGAALMPALSCNKALTARYVNFKSFGLRQDVIRGFMRDCNESGELELKAAPRLLQECLSMVLARMPIGGHIRGRDNKERIFAFVGPTGVGKTTSLAKLAAAAAVKKGQKTALITVDTFRVAAVAQLQTYARIMDLPLEVAVCKRDLEKAIRKHSNCELILIDAAGRSPNSEKDIRDLKELFSVQEDIHHYLVLSAATRFRELLHSDNQFGTLPISSYIFTKLDEVQGASSMVNFLLSRQKPVSYFTAGQQVPEDIEVATKKRLASLVLSRIGRVAENTKEEVRAYGSSFRA